MNQTHSIARVAELRHQYRKIVALDSISLDIPQGCMVGFIGPDGVGKSSLLSLLAGVRKIQHGRIEVLGGNIADDSHRSEVCPRIAYMPQGLGKNLYLTLTVYENVDFFGRLFGQAHEEREWRIEELLKATGLTPFRDRPAGKLSGGMKQKLGLCCALIHEPQLLILDEPTTGVDPLSRRQFWQLIQQIRDRSEEMSVLVATAYMDEAENFDWLVAMDDGRVLASGSPASLKSITHTESLDDAFIRLLPEDKRSGHKALVIPPRMETESGTPAISATDLSKRFGDFTAVDQVNFEINRGEIFGFLGSNGCGKTTTMKMLTGLLTASDGVASLFGRPVDADDLETRKRVGFMSQAFSLYTELTVQQNLELHAHLFHLPSDSIPARVTEMLTRFRLLNYQTELTAKLPLGIRQRLSLAVAVIHKPDVLILDEPTSGVDPVARDEFWKLLVELSRNDGVTIFISTHFMNEAERCDRISLMHTGRVLASDTPAALVASRNAESLEDAFVSYLQEAVGAPVTDEYQTPEITLLAQQNSNNNKGQISAFSLSRLYAYSYRETLEIVRDPIRLGFALFGTLLLMFVLGVGINMDVEDIPFAAYDHDRSPESRDYIQNIAGSRYFIQHPSIDDDHEMDRRMRSGELSLVIEIPPDYGRDLQRGRSPEAAAWIDGAMPYRAETISGYVQGMHYDYIAELALRRQGVLSQSSADFLQIRYRYNQDFKSIYAMVPAVIPLLLVMIPAILMALGVVREKELGSIINLYATPVSRLEFLLGKQLPYVGMGMINFFCMILLAVLALEVPFKGSLLALSVGAVLYITATTGLGLLVSVFTRTQIAALFGAMISTLLPAISFSGLTSPVSSLEGVAAVIGKLYPTSYFLNISRGTFTKALGFTELSANFYALLAFIPVLTLICLFLLKKQES